LCFRGETGKGRSFLLKKTTLRRTKVRCAWLGSGYRARSQCAECSRSLVIQIEAVAEINPLRMRIGKTLVLFIAEKRIRLIARAR